MNSRQLLFIVAALTLALVVIYISMGNQNTDNTVPEYITTESGDEYLPQEFDTSDIVTIDDISKIQRDEGCEKKTGEDKDSCYIGKAAINYDEKQCYLIGSVAFRDDCFLKIAVDGGKVDACENLTSGKSECYGILAQQQKDPRL